MADGVWVTLEKNGADAHVAGVSHTPSEFDAPSRSTPAGGGHMAVGLDAGEHAQQADEASVRKPDDLRR